MIIRPAVAVKMARGPTITLRSGAEFDLLDPWGSSFTLSDVAHGLAHICRYAGQCSGFYSVAEHSILVSEVATGCELQALMHDAAEAFLGDVTRPLKQLLPDYKKIETDVEAAVLARFGIETLGFVCSESCRFARSCCRATADYASRYECLGRTGGCVPGPGESALPSTGSSLRPVSKQVCSTFAATAEQGASSRPRGRDADPSNS